jgi:hypothetical protein
MLRQRASVLAVVALGVLFVPGLARAQTITISAQGYPNRNLPLRAQNLTPQGVSYSDCTSDMVLSFPMVVSGFDGTENLEVWASKTSDCTAIGDRGSGAVPVCWQLPGGFTAQPYNTTTSITIDLRAQDILGPQNNIPNPPQYHSAGPEACTTQSSYQAVPIFVDFVPVNSSNQPVGSAYQYKLGTDLVGPPAPTGIGETVGHTLMNVTWTANSDTDTAGYNIFLDPIRGQEATDSGTFVPEASTVTICPDTGAQVTDSGNDGATSDAGDDSSAATVDASGSTSTDAGCYTVTSGGTPTSATGYHCLDSILASGVTQDSGAVTTTTVDEAGNVIEGGTTTEGAGGISTIPDANRVGNSPTISDKSLGSYTITGLIDGVTYTAVVAAVDGYGNVGPPSSEVCDYPAPVQDFWQTYEADGGKGSGFCSLEAVGAGGTSLAGVATLVGIAGIVRRQRRRGR